jgi:hypothetical protein
MLVKRSLFAAIICLTGGAVAWELTPRERVLLSGSFHSVAHKGAGKAVITPGRLRLQDVRTYPSNDLEVCLIAAPDAEDNDTVLRSSPVCLGSFGNFSFRVPSDLDLNRYRSVVIWSPSYGVNFTTAPLSK